MKDKMSLIPFLHLGHTEDLVAQFIEHNKQIIELKNELKQLQDRVVELENIIHYGPNSEVMLNAKKDFEDKISQHNL